VIRLVLTLLTAAGVVYGAGAALDALEADADLPRTNLAHRIGGMAHDIASGAVLALPTAEPRALGESGSADEIESAPEVAHAAEPAGRVVAQPAEFVDTVSPLDESPPTPELREPLAPETAAQIRCRLDRVMDLAAGRER
jgi:hypothetical protein